MVTISTIARGRQAEAAEQRWALRSEVLVVPGETTHRCRARVVAESLAGEAVGLDLVVPAVARVADVRGDDVREWRVDAPESGTRRLRVAWATARVPVRELQVVYELPANRAKTSVSAPMLKGGAPGEPWLLAVAEPDGAEVVVAKGAQTERRTPAWMREMIEGRPVALSEMKDTAELELKWLPRVETRDVVVSKAEYVQRIVADGAVLVSAGYEVATTAGGQLEVELPEGADLLSCEVAGKRTRPVMRDGTLSIPLPAGLGRGVNVAISFTAKLPPLDPVSGKLTLVLPRSPLFMREINWLLQIPAAYEISSLEGNAQFVESKRTEEACEVRLRKELCNGERPEVLAYYARSEKNP